VFLRFFALGGIHFALGGVLFAPNCMAFPMSTLWSAGQCRQEANISAAKHKKCLNIFE
jgi:hypothetical protein